MKHNNLICKIFQSIYQVPEKDWDRVARGVSIIYSYRYWRLIEDSDLKHFYDFTYILIFEGKTPVFIGVCYFFKQDLSEYTNDLVSSLVKSVRKVFPNFLYLKVMEIGTPINIHLPSVLFASAQNPMELMKALTDVLDEIKRRTKPSLIGLKDAAPESVVSAEMKAFLSENQFKVIRSQPNTVIDLKWTSVDAYLDSMKSYYRSKLLKHLKRNDHQGITSQLTSDFSQIADVLVRQWLLVHNKPGHIKREVLNARFYRDIDEAFPEESQVLLLYEKDKLIGHALLLMDGDVLRWLYIGREKSENDSLYMFILYKIIETGIMLGVSKVDCGPTTYDIKQDMGARVEDLHYGFKLSSSILNSLLSGIISKFIELKPVKQRTVFKQ